MYFCDQSCISVSHDLQKSYSDLLLKKHLFIIIMLKTAEYNFSGFFDE